MSTNTMEHEIGLAGLALLRNWLTASSKRRSSILNEIELLLKARGRPVELKKFSVKTGYKNWSDNYDVQPNILVEIEERATLKLLQKISKGKALDLCCGTGRYTEILNKLGHVVVGIDQSRAMLAHAKKKSPKTKFICADINNIPVDDSSFDLVICSLALTHLRSISKVFSEISRVLKPKGKVVITDIHPFMVMISGHARFQMENGEDAYIINYTHWHNKYLDAFRNSNLKILECVEPTINKNFINSAQRGLHLDKKTTSDALLNIPMALIWLLEAKSK